MNRPKIAVILGSTRPGRNGRAVADWVLEQAKARVPSPRFAADSHSPYLFNQVRIYP